jgi:hypothetical protein
MAAWEAHPATSYSGEGAAKRLAMSATTTSAGDSRDRLRSGRQDSMMPARPRRPSTRHRQKRPDFPADAHHRGIQASERPGQGLKLSRRLEIVLPAQVGHHSLADSAAVPVGLDQPHLHVALVASTNPHPLGIHVVRTLPPDPIELQACNKDLCLHLLHLHAVELSTQNTRYVTN